MGSNPIWSSDFFEFPFDAKLVMLLLLTKTHLGGPKNSFPTKINLFCQSKGTVEDMKTAGTLWQH